MSLSGNTMAYVVYHFSIETDWEIYLATKKEENTWTKTKFNQNSKCREDNSEIFDNAKKIIFESTRKNAEGTECYIPEKEDKTSLWYSEKIDDKWSLPIIIQGEPNKGDKNTQPWVDEENNYLYWTADKDKDTIKRIKFKNGIVTGKAEKIIIPNIDGLTIGNANNTVVFVGEYSQNEEYVFIACGIATENGPFLNKWQIDINICVIPLK